MEGTLRLSAIAECICADKKPVGEVTDICTDSRRVTPGCLFVALQGERFDGHRFVADALKDGAICAVVHQPVEDVPPEQLLTVGDTQKALRRIADLYRRTLRTQVVAVTGSVGKTSTRDMIAAVLARRWRTHKTEANLNNEVGVPQTVLQIRPSHEMAVIEMGMSAPLEIEQLSLCAEPDVAVVTNIGVMHIEHLGSQENIFRAKMEIVEGLKPGGLLVLNGDDPFLRTYRAPDLQIVTYSIDDPDCTVRAYGIEGHSDGTRFTIAYAGGSYPAYVPAFGRHSVLNALAGFAVGTHFGMAPEEAAAALADYRPTGMRQHIVPFQGKTIVEDCYNAGPDSMQASLATFAGLPCTGRRIAVLGDMLELGDLAEAAHAQVGQTAAQLGLDAVYTVGELGRLICDAARAGGVADARHFTDKRQLAQHLTDVLREGDMAWFKASHGMHLEEVLEQLYGGKQK